MARGRKKGAGTKKEEAEQAEEKLEEQKEEQQEAKAEEVEEKQEDKEEEKQGEEKQEGEEGKQEGEEGKQEDVEKKPEEKAKRGGKRKGAKGKEKVADTEAPRRAKRARIVKPEVEPEYFSDQRNLEDLWKEVFPVGTEWDQLDSVYQYNWNFKNLEDAFEEGGELHKKRVYLFGCTEPQMVPFKDELKITIIPVVVAVVSPFPPSDMIGINSVQREKEEIIPMKKMKMDWVPYIPLESRDKMAERLKAEIYILGCTQRRSALRHLKEERLKKFEYCLPYFSNPFKEDEMEQSTIVDILYPVDPKPVFCEFDWELDELEEFTDKLVEEEDLAADQKDAFKEFVREKVRETKKTNREAREARKNTADKMSEEMKAAYEEMRFYKFYPVSTPDTPDVSNVKASFINRYYGKAHQVL